MELGTCAPSQTAVPNDQEDDLDQLVFQCAQCSAIVGDSSSWTGSNEVLRTISLKYVSKKIDVADRLITSKTGTDLGSTYNALVCQVCKADIGRQYRTTPSDLDHMRQVYTLYVEKISSYTFGKCEQETGSANINDLVAMSNIKDLYTELKKLQTVMVSLDSRIEALETSGTADCRVSLDKIVQHADKHGDKVYTKDSQPTDGHGEKIYMRNGRDSQPTDKLGIYSSKEHHATDRHSSMNLLASPQASNKRKRQT